ncbi:MAG TPA: molybdate ABC transporter substrate-binding protein [Acidimicrobiales bacterium]|nr:molybdate ABC transporter substrate-binding protein [Acidimicrobiales bacterium]
MTLRFLALVMAMALSTACTGSEAASKARTVKVSAAASLTEAFTELAEEYQAAHPGLRIETSFGASSALAQQVNVGAPVDVLATADEVSMKRVTDAGSASAPEIFARNRLALLVGRGNPKAITGLADLARPGVVFLACAPEVPCGRLAAAALEKAGVKARPASLEENVKGVVSKVTVGEADAGIVYATDVKAAGDRALGMEIDFAGDPALAAVYQIAVTSQAGNVEAARDWVDFVLSERGRQALTRFGFLPS